MSDPTSFARYCPLLAGTCLHSVAIARCVNRTSVIGCSDHSEEASRTMKEVLTFTLLLPLLICVVISKAFVSFIYGVVYE